MRREIKFELSKKEYEKIFNILNHFVSKDINTKFDNKYSIKTIYFDNIYDQLLKENIDGKLYRKKFRIRMYNNDTSSIFLEKKEKEKDIIYKTRERISYEEVQKICEGNFNKLILDTTLKKEFYIEIKTKLLKPVIVIEYDRIAFVNKLMNFRITLDSKLHSDKCIKNFFNTSYRKDNIYILEVKYESVLPKIVVDALNISGQRKGISKYKSMRLNKCYLK